MSVIVLASYGQEADLLGDGGMVSFLRLSDLETGKIVIVPVDDDVFREVLSLVHEEDEGPEADLDEPPRAPRRPKAAPVMEEEEGPDEF